MPTTDQLSLPLVLHWFRRDLRLDDNPALERAAARAREAGATLRLLYIDESGEPELSPSRDYRFRDAALERLAAELKSIGQELQIWRGSALEFFADQSLPLLALVVSACYEPAERRRDDRLAALLAARGIIFEKIDERLLFPPDVIRKADGSTYQIYTPYAKRLREKLALLPLPRPRQPQLPTREWLGSYRDRRDYPALLDGTSRLGADLRYGTISIRHLAARALEADEQTFLNELIWRDFFQMILYHHPQLVDTEFRPQWRQMRWRRSGAAVEADFAAWREGRTGYPLVDAGMRELTATRYMHNRVRMVVASFLCKHLLIDWRLGERHFAEWLDDYELASNNGNWQWSAGCGCDAAPYFRIFNPSTQLKRFDAQLDYVRRWIPEFDSLDYPAPIVDHNFARQRALATYAELSAEGRS